MNYEIKKGHCTIPAGVTSIGDRAFSGCTSLTSVTIPAGVTSIGDWAFSGCSRLTSVTIPAGVTSIGDWAFSGCTSLTSVTIPAGVTSIGDWAFYDCTSLTSVTIPESVTIIGDRAFYDCTSLTSVTIPAGVTSISDIDAKILHAIEAGGTLNMSAWHTCETTHCRAGWAVTLAGGQGKMLEAKYGTEFAARLIYLASRPGVPAPDFFGTTYQAMEDIRANAAARAVGNYAEKENRK